jgi:hypothetical protein
MSGILVGEGKRTPKRNVAIGNSVVKMAGTNTIQNPMRSSKKNARASGHAA